MNDPGLKELMSEEFHYTDRVEGRHDWSVPWADLMMVMFVLFVVLFIYSSSHQDITVLFSPGNGGTVAQKIEIDPLHGLIGRMQSHKSMMVKYREGADLDGRDVIFKSEDASVLVLREEENLIRVNIGGDRFFESGQSALNPESLAYLEQVAGLLKTSKSSVHVIGYADPSEATGAESFRLSSDRAASVMKYFVENVGIEAKRFALTGRGAYKPEVPSITRKNVARNRRVEIFIQTSG